MIGVEHRLRLVESRPVLVWRCDRPWLAISSAVLGGGIGERAWVLNATVGTNYDHPDPGAHVREMAAELGLSGPGTGMLTAVDVRHEVTSADSGVRASVTTGVSHPVWAAADGERVAAESSAWSPGTINAVCWSPVRLGEAALVNAVATVAEAKAQALLEAGVAGTGTVTDATVVLCPADGAAEDYGGPRSRVGSALARAVHAGVAAGLRVENPRLR
ncbi:adenosylcobinamide amidohydrolase [Saccharopolyspora erythraea]|uniref:adenosylcobinamide amidohydrolase n=1 Tax=Saccharopolyspora erythraea TaxID=1836 RepID=UPI001BA5D6D9|nr:adenosylcobinamide amidohydrolase [Saccharopolyspora erythraea]QUH04889.1 adenosylcobinamide amidohydrolase [Saccharopolyspora erythraea]